MRILERPFAAPPRGTTAMETANTLPRRKRGSELSLSRRHAMVVEIAMAIPPGKTRLPKGTVAPLAHATVLAPNTPQRYGKTAKRISRTLKLTS